MLQRSDMHQYQADRVYESVYLPEGMLWLDMGLGKTIIALTIIVDRMDRGEVYGSLIVAPLRVCQTVWRQEIKNWAHTKHLTCTFIEGNRVDRTRAAQKKSDIYLINHENLKWYSEVLIKVYLSKGRHLPFNNLIIDEICKLKSASGTRNTALRRLVPYIEYKLGLTGTPAGNGYKDLFGQYLLVDEGLRLGVSKEAYQEQYFRKTGYMGYDLTIKKDAKALIHEAISDITVHLNKEDYLKLPPVVVNDIFVDLDAETRVTYDTLEKEMFLAFDSGKEAEAANAAVLTGKCLQVSNGALYCDPVLRDWEFIHDAKLDILEDILDSSQGEPVLIFYQYQHDLTRMKERFPYLIKMGGGMTGDEMLDIEQQWNKGEIAALAGHAASIGHGLNLQYGGHTIVWFGIPWGLNLYKQANARLAARQGQTHPCVIHRILAKDTLDEGVSHVLEGKEEVEDGLKEAVNLYRKSRGM